MFKPIKCSSRTLTLLLGYPAFAIGQYWLFSLSKSYPELYDRLTLGGGDWIKAHLLLTVSLLLLFKGYLAISDYLRPTKGGWMASLSVFLTAVSVFVMLGQYAINLVLVEVFKMPRQMAEQTLANIQSNPVIHFLYREPGSSIGGFQFMLLPVVANLLMGSAFVFSGKIPRWAIVSFFAAFLITNFCDFTRLGFGGWIHYTGYILYAVSFVPVAFGLWNSAPRPLSAPAQKPAFVREDRPATEVGLSI
jgi:hypothetical protein